MLELIGLLFLAGAVILTVWHRDKHGRDLEIDRVLEHHESRVKESRQAGLTPSPDDILISNVRCRLD